MHPPVDGERGPGEGRGANCQLASKEPKSRRWHIAARKPTAFPLPAPQIQERELIEEQRRAESKGGKDEVAAMYEALMVRETERRLALEVKLESVRRELGLTKDTLSDVLQIIGLSAPSVVGMGR